MDSAPEPLLAHLHERLALVLRNLGREPTGGIDPHARFADLLDSMGLVELLGILAKDCGVAVEAIERAAGLHFGTPTDLARALRAAGIMPGSVAAGVRAGAHASMPDPSPATGRTEPAVAPAAWLAAARARLPADVQSAAELDTVLGRPAGWFAAHAGIERRRIWAGHDPLAAAAAAGEDCLRQAGLDVAEIGALLTTSEAPPLLTGLAAALHHRLSLRPGVPALELGGACTGFLHALWLARELLPRVGAVLLVAVEAPTRYVKLEPGPAGEAAALFGDGCAA